MLKLCVSVSVGLFDSAINYIWNATIIELRQKVVRFGLPIVAQLTSETLDETSLSQMMDNKLLKLCLKLSLISEEGYFKLDQCRATRNNFSAAHPAMGALDEDEVINFISRCAREALGVIDVPAGVNFYDLVATIKANPFVPDQVVHWTQAIKSTHSAQRELIATSLHGMFCDDSLGQVARNNCVSLFAASIELDGLPPKIIDQHQGYVGKGEVAKAAASRDFFTRFNLIGLLSEAERHAMVSGACDRLNNAHQGTNNFHNEPPFAARLHEIVGAAAIPDSVRAKFVDSVISCAMGNPYGVSWAACAYYENMVKDFSPKAMMIMLNLPNTNEVSGRKVKGYSSCRKRFALLVSLLNQGGIPSTLKPQYDFWVAEHNANTTSP